MSRSEISSAKLRPSNEKSGVTLWAQSPRQTFPLSPPSRGLDTVAQRQKILMVYGTRPEAIKMAPVVKAIGQSTTLHAAVAVTGQHRTMLDQVNFLFGIEPHHDLDIITQRQTLEEVTSRVLSGLSAVIEAEMPAAILVQGDTTTCFAAALTAFYHAVPVIHLEAGLRTGNANDPFPEEMNRRLTSQLATVHLAPTATAKANLLEDGIARENIYITGNTVVDALLDCVARDHEIQNSDLLRVLGKRMILVTAHRRESWGEPMARIGRALVTLAKRFPDVMFLLPAHLNPVVRETLLPPLQGLSNVVVTSPLSYGDFARALNHSTIVLTDSGGVQEEAPSLGKPVLVMRETTERPEAVAAGTVRLVGTGELAIVAEVSKLLTDPEVYDAMARAMNPYGDGCSADRCVRAIEHFFGMGERPADFNPVGSPPSLSRSSVPRPARIIHDLAAGAGEP